MPSPSRSPPAPQPSSSPRPFPSQNASSPADSPVGSFRARSYGTPIPRSDVTARLANPIPSPAAGSLRGAGRSSFSAAAAENQPSSGPLTPLAGGSTAGSGATGPGVSALAMALSGSLGASLPRHGTPPVRSASPALSSAAGALGATNAGGNSPATTAALSTTPLTAGGGGQTPTHYGSFESRPRYASTTGAYEDPEIIRRHLVQRTDAASVSDHQTSEAKGKQPSGGNGDTPAGDSASASDGAAAATGGATGIDDDEFSSLQLQGGDITRPIYKWAEEATNKVQRSKSFTMPRPEPASEVLDIHTIKVPGGFRRNYLRRTVGNGAADEGSQDGHYDAGEGDGLVYQDSSSQQHHRRRSHLFPRDDEGSPRPAQKRLFTASFLEFLSIYGHFAGEELEEDDEVLRPGEYFSSGDDDQSGEGDGEGGDYAVGGSDGSDDGSGSGSGSSGSEDEDHEPMEDSALLTPSRRRRQQRRRRRKTRGGSGKTSPMGAANMLLKSFVGTGVLFLPRAYLSGGMLFSNLVLLFVAALSYYCFVLLVTTRLRVVGSFGDIGGILYGRWLRFLILSSIVLSQIGFVAAYIVFTSQNLQAVILAVSKCQTLVPIEYLILLQMVIFLPFSLLRDISKLGFTALVADAFIVIGLAYLFYYDVLTLHTSGLADIRLFNKDSWTLFIGTAIFTFEGIGLIIPIQESMRHPQQFPRVLFVVMIIITTIFVTMGAVSYAAYGSKTETVVLLNLPQDNPLVNGVQFLYSLAILLSTPLQIFPAIRITENGLFTRSGKYNPYIKWQKNVFRFFVVAACAAIAWGGADSLDKFVALVGNFACIPLVYIYPPMLHYKAVARSTLWKVSDLALCVFGFIAMAYTTSLTIMSWASEPTEPPLPGYCDSPNN